MLKLILACAVVTFATAAYAEDRVHAEDRWQQPAGTYRGERDDGYVNRGLGLGIHGRTYESEMARRDWRHEYRFNGVTNAGPRCTWRKRLDDFGHMHNVRVCLSDR